MTNSTKHATERLDLRGLAVEVDEIVDSNGVILVGGGKLGVTQAATESAVPAVMTITNTIGTLPTPDGTSNIGDVANPSSSGLLDALVELQSDLDGLRTTVNSLITKLQSAGVIASS